MTTQRDPICCAVCDATGPETAYRLMRFQCGHILCPICQAQPCPVCADTQPSLDDPTPHAEAVASGACMIWAYGELSDIPEEDREDREHLVLLLTCLRLWAESVGVDTAEAWRQSWQRSMALTQTSKARR
jgi:hypothetical protein